MNIQGFSKELEGRLEVFGRVLESTSYRTVLKRGFAVVHGPEGLIGRAAAVAAGMALELEFADGRARATGLGEGAAPAPRTKPKRRRKAAKDDDGSQGTLF